MKSHKRKTNNGAQQENNNKKQKTNFTSNDEQTIVEHSCGTMDHVCNYCFSLNFLDEKTVREGFLHCCHNGTVIHSRRRFPAFLEDMLKNTQNPNHAEFIENIRAYNSALAFASFSAQTKLCEKIKFPIVKIFGQIYHKTLHANPEEGQKRQYSQLYVIDSETANQERMNCIYNIQLNPDIISRIDNFIREHNPYAKAYYMLHDVETNYLKENKNMYDSQCIPKINMVFKRNPDYKKITYNEPEAKEIAMIFYSDDGAPPFEQDFQVYLRPDAAPQPAMNLDITSPNLSPMVYPIFFPYGSLGWQPNLPIKEGPHSKKQRKKITMLQWVVSELAMRQNTFNPLLHGGRLTQQYIVNMYINVEAQRLNFIRSHQKELRAEQYSTIIKFAKNAEKNNQPLGRTVILPSSFSGSPRNKRENYYDAMAMVREFGKPDFFVTMTCNPYWTDISENLFQGQQSFDRPDIVARVFKIKLKALITELTINQVFGKVDAYLYTIEFQKRGLPHAHILLFLNQECKPRTPEDIDAIIKAEFPNQYTKPTLYKIVKQTMVHKPCGNQNPMAPCMRNGACIKHFPKEYSSKTILQKGKYPLYKRQPRLDKNETNTIDNEWIISYNEYLLEKYNCHINVEYCYNFNTAKYLFKYVHKGYDSAEMELSLSETSIQQIDEPKDYVNTRYVSAPEAIWRLFEFPMHEKSHTVYRLTVHLPKEQTIYFVENDIDAATSIANNKHTQLTAWFILNKNDKEAKQYLYPQIPIHYTWDKTNCEWKKRIRGESKIITRIYPVSPKDTERFYLRLLLQNIRGAKWFKDLKTVQNIEYKTFKQAAIAMGLTESDIHWENCLQEASEVCAPQQVRFIFAIICIYNSPQSPLSLYRKFKKKLTEDYSHLTKSQAQNKALMQINKILEVHGLNVSFFNLPKIKQSNEEMENIETTIYQTRKQKDENDAFIKTLNYEQKKIFDEILETSESKTTKNKFFFIDGPGGTGKTYLYTALIKHFENEKKRINTYATTGIAADLLKNARTVHSGFGIPLSPTETSTSTLKLNSTTVENIKTANGIIIDEVSMMSKYSLQIINKLLQEIMQNKNIFGGKLTIIGGDFRQTANIILHGTNTDIVETSIKKSFLWEFAKKRKLTTNMRSKNKTKFNNWILQIGNDELGEMVTIPNSFLLPKPENLITEIYSNLTTSTNSKELISLMQKTILTPKNETARRINNLILDLIPSQQEKIYTSIDSITHETISENDQQEEFAINTYNLEYPPEFLNKLTPSGMPEHQIKLKTGTLILLLRNLDPSKGLLNGTRLIVQNLYDNFIKATIITGTHKGTEACIPRIDLTSAETHYLFTFKRRQLPIMLGYAMTINRSQGQSFNHVGIYLPQPVFAHGQLYVALSRCKNPDNLKIVIDSNKMGKNTTLVSKNETKNIVIKELLD